MRERRPRFVAAGGVADLGCEIADDDHPCVAKVLKITHLADRHQMPQMDVVTGGVDPEFDPQRLAGLLAFFEFGQQIFQRNDLIHCSFYHFQFLFKTHFFPYVYTQSLWDQKRQGVYLSSLSAGMPMMAFFPAMDREEGSFRSLLPRQFLSHFGYIAVLILCCSRCPFLARLQPSIPGVQLTR